MFLYTTKRISISNHCSNVIVNSLMMWLTTCKYTILVNNRMLFWINFTNGSILIPMDWYSRLDRMII